VGGARPPPFITFTITSKVAVYAPVYYPVLRSGIRDSGLGAFLTPGSRIRDPGSGMETVRIRDPGSGMETVRIRDPGSGIRDGKKSDPGSGINIPDPPHWY
jgi:hypothetical protein